MKSLYFFILFLFGCNCLFSQKFTTSFDGLIALPQGEYKKINKDAGLGIKGNLLFRPKPEVPVKFGIELGMQVKGSTSQYFSGVVYGFYEEYKVSASNNIFSLAFITRLQPLNKNKIKPFIDAIAGWNVFFSTVNIEELSYYNPYNASYSNSSKAHWAFSYGTAAGLDIPLNKRDALGIEVKVAYMIGSESKYLTDPIIDNGGNVSFAERQSKTNMLVPQIGIRIDIL